MAPNIVLPVPSSMIHRGAFDESAAQDVLNTFLQSSALGQPFQVGLAPTLVALAGGGQAGATPLTGLISRVGTCAAQGNSVSLVPALVGACQIVINRGAQPMQVFGATGDTINGIATATGVSQGVNTTAIYTCCVKGNWEVPISMLITTTPLAIAASGAVAPHVQHVYVITKAGVAALTLAAPTVTTDDGNIISFTSNTPNAHTLTATGLLGTGSAFVNVATFNAQLGATLELMAYQGLWLVQYANGISFS